MSFVIDTALNGQGPYSGKAYFFKGSQFVRYDWNSEKTDAGYPMDLAAWHFPGDFQTGINAALNGVGRYAGKAYFFRGNQYIRYDWATDRVDEGYPLDLSAWKLPQEFLTGIDAAFNGNGELAGKAFIFKDQQYVVYDWGTEQVDGPYKLAALKLPSPCSLRIDAALEGQGRYAGRTYFFRHSTYVRYDWTSKSCDQGYPAHIGLWNIPDKFLFPSGKTRDHIWYVTIDDFDYYQQDNHDHDNNLEGLRRVVEKLGIQVDPIWMGNLRNELLADGTLLALFGAGGSFEWFLAAEKPEWGDALDKYCGQMLNSKVPMLAVCATHQLIAKAVADWGAVGHMAQAEKNIKTIADEFAQKKSLIPKPRLGEVGKFPLRPCEGMELDPLLADIPRGSRFVEYHHDYICAVNEKFSQLLQPDPDNQPEFFNPEESGDHKNPSNAQERCQVQALRLNDPSRVLYTTQFHPELRPKDEDTKGAKLIENFVGIAKTFWDASDQQVVPN